MSHPVNPVDPVIRFVRGFARFWYDFVVGDDPKIAGAVASVLVLGALLVGDGNGTAAGSLLLVGLTVLLLAAFTVAMLVDVAVSRRGRD